MLDSHWMPALQRLVASSMVAAGFAVVFTHPPGLDAQVTGGVSEELRALYEADQADRAFTALPTVGDWDRIRSRDTERRRRVYELLRVDSLEVAGDYYHSAMILQHGEAAEDILLAHILATASAFLGDERGRWLSAASLDRYLHRTRMPQRLGTQARRSSLEDPFEVDASQPISQGPYVRWLPDSIRRIYGVRTLAEQIEWVRSLNRGPGAG